MIRIGNVMYASNQDAQSGVMARLVSKGRGVFGYARAVPGVGAFSTAVAAAGSRPFAARASGSWA